MARYFSLADAEDLLPQIEPALRDAIALKAEFLEARSEFEGAIYRVTILGGSVVDRERFLTQRSRRDTSAAALKDKIEEIHNRGCVIKDLDMGLIDFPALFRGQEVYLCWKLGENRISFWHGVEEGFRGRKTIDQDFLDNLAGGRPN